MDEIIKYNSASGDTIKLHLPLDSAVEPAASFRSIFIAIKICQPPIF